MSCINVFAARENVPSAWMPLIASVLIQFSSVQFSRSVVSDSLRPHESQHARPPCPSQIPGVYPNPCPSSWWCHPAISPSVVPFSSCPQSLPTLGSFPVSQFFPWGGQSTGVSASASILPMNTHDWSPLGWIGWVQGTLKSLLQCFYTPKFSTNSNLSTRFYCCYSVAQSCLTLCQLHGL